MNGREVNDVERKSDEDEVFSLRMESERLGERKCGKRTKTTYIHHSPF